MTTIQKEVTPAAAFVATPVTATQQKAAVATKPAKAPRVAAKEKAKPVAKKTLTAQAAVKKPALKPKASIVKAIRLKADSKTTAAKPSAKPAPKLQAKSAEKLAEKAKLEKPKKPKLVRDSFTIPKTEYLVLDDLKLRANQLTRPVKKSELLRAGIKALAALSDAAFLSALDQVPAIKTGRPARE